MSSRKFWEFKMIAVGLFLLLITGTSAQIKINDAERTWTDANLSCRLLGSKESGLFSESLFRYEAQLPQNGKMFWIAAMKKTTAPFKFDQCVSIENLEDFPYKPLQDTYNCYEFCNGTLFAISSSQCVCTTSRGAKRTTVECSDKLKEETGTQMDFYITDSEVFLEYKKGEKDSIQGVGDCAAVIWETGGGQSMHEFLPCNTTLPSICDEDNFQTEEKTWTEAVLSCKGILKGSFDGFYSLQNAPSKTTKAWTGISRRSIIQWSKGLAGNVADSYECIAVSKSNNTVQIHAKNCSDLLPSLCEQSDTTLVSSTQISTSESETTSFEISKFSDVPTIDTTSVTYKNTSLFYLQTSPVFPTGKDAASNVSDSLILPIVSGTAAGVIIILLIVFIVLYRRFQRKNGNKVNRHSSGAVYSETNKSRKKSSTGPEGAALQVDTDDTYDHTVNRKSRQSVHSVQENMYDHTTAPQKEPAEDNFYDSTCRNPQKDTIINDNEYGSVNPATGNDVYSHTNQVFSSSDTNVENYDSMNNLE